ncbi:MAG: ABC transporter ATP-binding protein [Acidimicrobiia bacterium]
MSNLIQVEGLSRTFDGPQPVRALRDCTFSVASGEMVAVTGPSGSGKSTLLNCLGLLDRPTSGRYLLEERDVVGLAERHRAAFRARRIGFVFQDYNLLWGRTALDNVALGPIYQRMRVTDREHRAEVYLDLVGLSHRQEALVETLSGGERQRVAIARALAGTPGLLLCDEPTGNLDSETGDTILALLEGLHAEGQTIVIVTHDPTVAARASRRFRMSDGTLTEEP